MHLFGMRVALLILCLCGPAFGQTWVSNEWEAGSFPIVGPYGCAEIVYSPNDEAVIGIAATDLAKDLERITGQRPALTTGPGRGAAVVYVGTVGKSATIDRILSERKLDASRLNGTKGHSLINPKADKLSYFFLRSRT